MHKLTLDIEKCDDQRMKFEYPIKTIAELDKIIQVIATELGVTIVLPKTKKGGG